MLSVHLGRSVITPTIRVLGRTPAFVGAGLAAAPVLLTIIRGGTDLERAVVAAAVIGAASLAFAVADPTAIVAPAASVSVPIRQALSLVVVASAVLLAWVTCWLAAELRGLDLGDVSRLGAQAVATAGVGLALASGFARRGEPNPGMSGATGALLVVLTSSALSTRYPILPTLVDGRWSRWWWVTLGGWSLAAWWSRDPAARSPECCSVATRCRTAGPAL